MSVIKIILIGRLGRDPEVRHMPNGHAHAEFDGFCDRLCNLIQAEKYGQKHYFPCSLPLFLSGGVVHRLK